MNSTQKLAAARRSLPGTRNSFWKHSALAVIMTLLAGLLTVSAQQQPTFLTNGLVAYYPFNASLTDSSGNGNDGRSADPSQVEYGYDRFGKNKNSSLLINDQIVEIPEFPASERRQLTISLWFKATDIAQESYLIGKDIDSAPLAPSRQWALFYRSTSKTNSSVDFVRWSVSNGITNLDGIRSTTLDSSLWNHVVVSCSSNTLALYLNGQLNSAMGSIGQDAAGNEPIRVGNGQHGASIHSFSGGLIDDVRIYDRTLSKAEVSSLYSVESTLFGHSRVAYAISYPVNGFVTTILVVDGGSGYTTSPKVTINGGGGTGATAQAVISDGTVTEIRVTNPGKNYTSETTIIIDPPPVDLSIPATAAAMISGGFVVGVAVANAGYGYTEPPAVKIEGGGGTGATAVATVFNGIVNGITILDPGSGYTSTPDVIIASPPFDPVISIAVSKVRVTLKVVMGRKYQIESSGNLSIWAPTGPVFVAESELLNQEFDVATTGRYFRINQVP